MTEFILALYAATCAFATIAYVGFGWASSKRPISHELHWQLGAWEGNRNAPKHRVYSARGHRDWSAFRAQSALILEPSSDPLPAPSRSGAAPVPDLSELDPGFRTIG